MGVEGKDSRLKEVRILEKEDKGNVEVKKGENVERWRIEGGGSKEEERDWRERCVGEKRI